MFGSIAVGRLFGITIRVHWMWLAMVLLLPMLVDAQPLASLVAFLVVFGIVLLHELGHSLMARRLGIRTLDITLWPLGGMARMDHIPERPTTEILIAIAGPLVNFALAAVGVALLIALGVFGELIAGDELGFTPFGLIGWFVIANVLMGGFNLIPAFPMDGGRVLRAFLGYFTDWLAATTLAVMVGRAFAFAMIALGVLGWFMGWSQTAWFPLLGVFLWFAGARELFGVRLRRAQEQMRAGMFGGAPPWETPHQGEPPRNASDPTPDDPSGARRPDVTSVEPPPTGGITRDDVERLERYRGRLRPRDGD